MKRTLLAALIATGALASAQSFAATYGDENDTSWLPQARSQQATGAQADAGARFVRSTELPDTHNGVRIGDENNTSWLPQPAKR